MDTPFSTEALYKMTIDISDQITYSQNMETQTTQKNDFSYNGKFKLGARPPQRLSAAARKQLDEAVPSPKVHEMAARFARSKVIFETLSE